MKKVLKCLNTYFNFDKFKYDNLFINKYFVASIINKYQK